jgi:hypothetical protein
MRIVNEGKIEHGYEGRWTCSRCHCEWELDNKDPSPEYINEQRDGDVWQMPCPKCNNRTYKANRGGYYGTG